MRQEIFVRPRRSFYGQRKRDMQLPKPPLAMLFSMARECPRAIQTQCIGTARLPDKDLRSLKTASVRCMSRVWAVHEILLWQLIGIEKLQNREIPLPRQISQGWGLMLLRIQS